MCRELFENTIGTAFVVVPSRMLDAIALRRADTQVARISDRACCTRRASEVEFQRPKTHKPRLRYQWIAAVVTVVSLSCCTRDSQSVGVDSKVAARSRPTTTQVVGADSGAASQVGAESYLIGDQGILCRVNVGSTRCILAGYLSAHFRRGEPLRVATITARTGQCTGHLATCTAFENVSEYNRTARFPVQGTQSHMVHGYIHHCSTSRDTVSCVATGNELGFLGTSTTPSNEPTARGRTRIAHLLEGTLTLGPGSTCIADTRNDVWCWGVFGVVQRHSRDASRLRSERPVRVGSLRGVRQLIATDCGVCAFSDRAARCWLSASHRIRDAYSTREGEHSFDAPVLYDFVSTLCGIEPGVLICSGVGGRTGCDRTQIPFQDTVRVASPSRDNKYVAILGYLCTIDRADNVRCLASESLGSAPQWRVVEL